MFEELNQHRAAVAEQIQKACEIGFTGGELEKAHKVGDIHPNGKWVWTQLPSGRYDWRVIKKTSQPAATGAGSAAQKTAPQKLSAQSSSKSAGAIKSWDKLSDFYKVNSDERRLWMHWNNFINSGDPSQVSSMRQILEAKFPNVAQWKQTAPNTGGVKLTAVDGDGNEVVSIDLSSKSVDLPKLQTFMDKCSEVKASEKKDSAKQNKESEIKMPATIDEAKKMGKIDVAKVNAYDVPQTLYGCKSAMRTYGKEGAYSGGIIEQDESNLRVAFNRKIGTKWGEANSEEEKLKEIQEAADRLATDNAIVKRIVKVRSDLKKLEEEYLKKAGRDFSEDEVKEWLKKYNTADDAAATVDNTWRYSMGRIGSTSATIQIGKGKDKPLFDSWGRMNAPSWRPIGMIHYSIPNYYSGGYTDINIPVQSWDDVENGLSGTESFRLYLYKHPKQ